MAFEKLNRKSDQHSISTRFQTMIHEFLRQPEIYLLMKSGSINGEGVATRVPNAKMLPQQLTQQRSRARILQARRSN